MIVCHCRVVNHREIGDAVAAGARTVTEVSAVCGAGTACGGCMPAVADMLAEHLDEPITTPCRLPRRVHAAA
ncbi:MAG TPA: (2Fe-2S)-binding protein [Acidimicrobiales bacterium]